MHFQHVCQLISDILNGLLKHNKAHRDLDVEKQREWWYKIVGGEKLDSAGVVSNVE